MNANPDRPTQLVLAALVCFVVALAVLLLLASSAGAAPAQPHVGDRISGWAVITYAGEYVDFSREYQGRLLNSNIRFGVWSMRRFRLGQVVRVSGVLITPTVLDNARIR